MTPEEWLIAQVSKKWTPDRDHEQYKAYLALLLMMRLGQLDEFIGFIEDSAQVR